MIRTNGNFSHHTACINEQCGSSDAMAIYVNEDGTVKNGFCWSCKKWFSANDIEGGGKMPIIRARATDSVPDNVDFVLELPIVALEDRGISQAAAEHFGIRTQFNQTTGKPECYYFPYMQGSHLCYKRKWIDKDHKPPYQFVGNIKGKPSELFGQRTTKGTKFLIITEGECFTGDAEVLTPSGWICLKDYSGQQVMSVLSDGAGRFNLPIAYIEKYIEDDLIEYSSGSWYSLTTKQHNIVRVDKQGRLIKQEAQDNTLTNYKIPRVLSRLDTKSTCSLTDIELQAMVMFSADWSYGNDQGGPRGAFKKDRKKRRVEYILDSLGLEYSVKDGPREGFRYYRIFDGQPFTHFWAKKFDHSLLGKLSQEQAQIILAEIAHWDGNVVPNRNQIEYSSKYLDNAVFIQTLAHLCGFTSTIIPRENKYGAWFKVSVLFDKQTSSAQKPYKLVPYKGNVYCVTVPSGMLLIRQNGSISVSGNCDAAAAWDILKRHGKQWNVVSLPSGANASAIRDNFKYVYEFTQIALALDNDEPGVKAAADISKLLDPGQLKVIEFKEFKDSNDYLKAGAYKEWMSALYGAAVKKPDGIVTISDIWDEAIRKPEWGANWPWPKLTNLTYGRRLKEIYGIGAGTGTGKSEWFKELVNHVIVAEGKPIGCAFLEEPAVTSAKRIAGKQVNKKFFIPDASYEQEELEMALMALDNKLWLYNHNGFKDWKSIAGYFKYLNRSQGVEDFILDNLTAVVAQEDSEYTALNGIMEEMASLAESLNVRIYYASHLRKPVGKPHEEGGRVQLPEFKGSGAMANWSHFIFGLERNTQAEDKTERNTTTFRVLKDRYTGLSTGATFELWYDHNTGIYRQKTEDDFFHTEEVNF